MLRDFSLPVFLKISKNHPFGVMLKWATVKHFPRYGLLFAVYVDDTFIL